MGGGGGGGAGGPPPLPPSPSFGGPPNIRKSEKLVACVHPHNCFQDIQNIYKRLINRKKGLHTGELPGPPFRNSCTRPCEFIKSSFPMML